MYWVAVTYDRASIQFRQECVKHYDDSPRAPHTQLCIDMTLVMRARGDQSLSRHCGSNECVMVTQDAL